MGNKTTKKNTTKKNTNIKTKSTNKENINIKTRKINKFNVYAMALSLLLGWLSITNILIITKYDVLPLKFWLPLMIPLLLIPGLLIFFMLRKKVKPKIKKILSGISIIFTIFFIVLLFYVNKTFNFINKLGETGYTTENYSVIVLSDSNCNKIEDIDTKKLGYYNNEMSNIEEALTKIEEVITVNKIKNDNYAALVDSLYKKENDAILIEESYRGIIEETNENFSEETKVIYTIEIEKKSEDISKNVNVKNETFNIYISGIDTYGKISSVSRSDVNIVATVNPTTHQVLLTTIPRDYYVQLDGTTGYKDKLTHAGIYGIDKSIKTIENLLNIEINYYIKVNFSSVEKLVDALGGVDVYSQYTFVGTGGSRFINGYNRVNGKQALEFARTRKTISGGDRTRGKNQQALIQAMLNKACSKEIITRYSSILSSLEGSFQTNMSTNEITDIIKKQINEMKPWNVTSISLDGTGASMETYSYKTQKLYVMVPNEETIENAKTKINQVINGETLESSYQENDGIVNTPIKQTKPTNNTTTVKPSETNTEKNNNDKKEENSLETEIKKEEETKEENKESLTEDISEKNETSTPTEDKKTEENKEITTEDNTEKNETSKPSEDKKEENNNEQKEETKPIENITQPEQTPEKNPSSDETKTQESNEKLSENNQE